MAVSEDDKQVVIDALTDLGAKDPENARNLEIITAKTRSKGGMYANKQHIANILQTLQNEKKVRREARQKTAVYYLVKEEPKPVEEKPAEINPYLITSNEGSDES